MFQRNVHVLRAGVNGQVPATVHRHDDHHAAAHADGRRVCHQHLGTQLPEHRPLMPHQPLQH